MTDAPGGAAWVLNLDAEEEMALWPRPYTPARRTAAYRRALDAARMLLAAGDVVIEEDGEAERHTGREGRAWCPTPRALAALARAGATSPSAPAAAVLAFALDRRSFHALGAPLPGAFVAASPADLERAGRHDVGGRPSAAWIAKRPFTSAGRGTRTFRLGFDPALLSAAERDWLAASFARGGLEIVPWVAIVREYGRHGELSSDGTLAIGRTCVQEVDSRGAWLATRAATPAESPRELDDALGREVERTGEWLRAHGYHGPFGIDSFVHTGGTCTRSEVNARHSMGHAVGFGKRDRVQHR